MNYLNLVLDGYLIENNRDHLTDFFASEFKKAERDHFISADLFFDGCIKVIDQLKQHLKEQVIERKRELYQMLTEMQKGTIEVDGKKGKVAINEYKKLNEYCSKQLADERPDGIGDLTFGINLFHITKGQRFGQLFYFDVLTIEDSLNEAKNRVNGLSVSKKSTASTSTKSKAGRPGSKPKSPEQYIIIKIPEFRTKFIELLKTEFGNSKSRDIALMFLALIKMGHLNEPANFKELFLSFTNYFGSTVNYTQCIDDFNNQLDSDILTMEKRIGNIKNKNGIT
jgi:hypothetical protein